MSERVHWVSPELLGPPPEPIGVIKGFVRDDGNPPLHDAENCPDCRPIRQPSGERVWIHEIQPGEDLNR